MVKKETITGLRKRLIPDQIRGNIKMETIISLVPSQYYPKIPTGSEAGAMAWHNYAIEKSEQYFNKMDRVSDVHKKLVLSRYYQNKGNAFAYMYKITDDQDSKERFEKKSLKAKEMSTTLMREVLNS